MRKHKRKFEDYEEIALCLRTAKQLLYRTEVIFHRAPYADAMTTIYKKLDRIISKTEQIKLRHIQTSLIVQFALMSIRTRFLM